MERTERINSPGRYAVTKWRGRLPAIELVLRLIELSALRRATVSVCLGSTLHLYRALVFHDVRSRTGGVSQNSRT